MSCLIRPLKKSFLLRSSSTNSKILTLLSLQQQRHLSLPNPILQPNSPSTYVLQSKISLLNEKFTRIVRYETHYELDQLPLTQPGKEYGFYVVDDRPGEKWITLSGKFGNNEDIKIEATLIEKSPCVFRKYKVWSRHHVNTIISINKEGSSKKLEILCMALPKRLKIVKLGTRKLDQTPASSYFDPEFKELDDKLIDALYLLLKERGIDDNLAVYLHSFMKNKEKLEYIRWLETMEGFYENK